MFKCCFLVGRGVFSWTFKSFSIVKEKELGGPDKKRTLETRVMVALLGRAKRGSTLKKLQLLGGKKVKEKREGSWLAGHNNNFLGKRNGK